MTEEQFTNPPRTHQFQAEVQHLLDIVINSLYTDKEIFVRELISNAADALEKIRHYSLTETDVFNKENILEIRIDTDEEKNTFTITDSGLGMTAAEAEENLGTIAHSGSREFLRQIADGKQADASLIGQFGVGFYSAFTVAKEVVVKSRSYRPDAKGIAWFSEGAGEYTILETEGLHRGTSITVKLKDEFKKFSKADTIKELIRRYSNFVSFPIFVQGEQVNTIQAIWTRRKEEIKEEEYKEFYHFIQPGMDDPIYRLHFNVDVPLGINTLLFFPGNNFESFGLGRMEPGVSLYCRKVLIQQNSDKLLPEYLRFLRGVVDSEDLPLNISREAMQDNALISKLQRVITKKVIKFLQEEAATDADKYADFYSKFGNFIKEGTYSDFNNREEMSKLLRFDSSKMEDGKVTSLDEYVERMAENQEEIYFITGPTRESIKSSPYLEAFADNDLEVVFLYDGMDDLVMTSLREFKGKTIISVDSANLNLPEKEKKEGEEEDTEKPEALPELEAGNLARWIKEVLGDKVEDVKISKRLKSSPAALVNPDDMMTTTLHRALSATKGNQTPALKFILEINPSHSILRKMNELRTANKDDELAREAAGMLYDNAQISAGMVVDPKVLVDRATRILEKALNL